MKMSKLVLLAIAVIAIGIFALPSTVSLFSGQHRWYNISGTGNEIPCIKCHADIYDEYLFTGVHGTLSGGSNSWTIGDEPNEACGACHRTAYEKKQGWTYGSGDGVDSTPGEEAHAASTVACMACHEFNNAYGAPAAGGFSMPFDNSSYVDPVSGLHFDYTDGTHPGGHAAHQGFIEGAINFSRMEDANEACLGCHTHIPVKINWTHARNLEFNATYNASLNLPPTHFDTSDYEANGSVEITSYGNYTGGANTTAFPTPVAIWDS